MLINSLQNPKIKFIKKLEKANERKEHGLFVIEGMREICLAALAGFNLTQLFICKNILKETHLYQLKNIPAVDETFEVSQDVYNSLAYREGTEGIIAVAKIKQQHLNDCKLLSSPLILVAEGVEKPGNLGALLRTADACGIDAVIVCDPKTDIFNSNVIRSSIGTVFTNKVIVCETEEAVQFFETNKIEIVAAELNATQTHYETDFKKGIAVIVGTEADGLSEKWLRAATQKIKIPMFGKIDSLNVSVSAAVLLYEAIRQRQL